ncbi:MAG: phage holin family protein [Patiriisocius sp.]|uniref:phage holin family protein n=1 Tax=Patiriisocius sp. TaxID=2822396 RepID=UPI003EF57B03
MPFKELTNSINITGDKAQEYIENLAEYYKLRLFKYSMKFATSLINMLLLGGIAILLLMFLSVGFALYLNSVFGSMFSGFFIVAGIYLIVIICIVIFGKKIITQRILSKFSELLDDNDEKDFSAEDVAKEKMKEVMMEKVIDEKTN